MKRLYSAITVCACLFFILLLSGCAGKPSAGGDFGTSISIQLPGNPRASIAGSESITPTSGNSLITYTGSYTNPDDITKYEIHLSSPECNFNVTRAALPGESVIFAWLFEGDYTMSIVAFNNANVMIFGGEKRNITVIPRQNTPVKMALTCLTKCRASNSCAPSKPLNFAVSVLSGSGFALTWTDTSDDEDGFIISRRIGSENVFTEIARVEANVSMYDDNEIIDAGETVWYLIYAYKRIAVKVVCRSFPVSVHIADDGTNVYNTALFNKNYWE